VHLARASLALRGPRLIATPGRGILQEYEAQQTHQLLQLLQRFDALVYDDDGARARAAATHAASGAGVEGAGGSGEDVAREEATVERRVVRMRPDRQVIRPLEVRLPHPPTLSLTYTDLPRGPSPPCSRAQAGAPWCHCNRSMLMSPATCLRLGRSRRRSGQRRSLTCACAGARCVVALAAAASVVLHAPPRFR
jgi:hypothetical protein